MWQGFSIRPDQASTIAQGVDYLYYFLTAIDLFFTAVIFLTIFYFALRYRRRSQQDQPPQIEGSLPLEIAWILIPLGICVVVFLWGTSLFIRNSRPPAASTEIFVVGKQWMWKLQHPEGVEEINELHVPVNQPIKLTMTSEDVIHDFSVPAFRVKKDVVPGMYTELWFQATKTGRFDLYCDQYCGTNHSAMIGTITALSPADYKKWTEQSTSGMSLAQNGERIFASMGCNACHSGNAAARGPNLAGVFGSTLRLTNGSDVLVNEAYLRDAILNPSQHVTSGYTPIMPTYQGQISEDGLIDLVEYLKNLNSNDRVQQTLTISQSGQSAPPASGVVKP